MWDSDSKNRDTSLSALQMWLSGAWLRIHSSAKGLWMMPSSGISFVICWQVWSVSDCGTQQRKKFIHNCRPLFIYQSSFFTQFKIIGRKVSNHFSCKYLVYHRIPLRQLDDLRCSSLKIKRNLTPFAVVVQQQAARRVSLIPPLESAGSTRGLIFLWNTRGYWAS